MTVSSDNPAGVDSRAFGPVPVAGSYRVVLAIPAASCDRWLRPEELDRDAVGVPPGDHQRMRSVLDRTVLDPELVHRLHQSRTAAALSTPKPTWSTPMRDGSNASPALSSKTVTPIIRPPGHNSRGAAIPAFAGENLSRAEQLLIEIGAASQVADGQCEVVQDGWLHRSTVR